MNINVRMVMLASLLLSFIQAGMPLEISASTEIQEPECHCGTCEYIREQMDRLRRGKKLIPNEALVPSGLLSQEHHLSAQDAYGWPEVYYRLNANRTDSDGNGLRECRYALDFIRFQSDGYYTASEMEEFKQEFRRCIGLWNQTLAYVGLEFKEVSNNTQHILVQAIPLSSSITGEATLMGGFNNDQPTIHFNSLFSRFGAFLAKTDNGASEALYKRPPGNPFVYVFPHLLLYGRNGYRIPISETFNHEIGHLVGLLHPFTALNNSESHANNEFLIDWLSWPVINFLPPETSSTIYAGENFQKNLWSRSLINSFMTYDRMSNLVTPDIPPPIRAFIAHYYGMYQPNSAQQLLDRAIQDYYTVSPLARGELIQEQEPNNTLDQAQPISLLSPVLGALSSASTDSTDEQGESFLDILDYYSFTIPYADVGHPMQIKITMGSQLYQDFYFIRNQYVYDGMVQIQLRDPYGGWWYSDSAEFPVLAFTPYMAGQYIVSVGGPTGYGRRVFKDYVLSFAFTDGHVSALPTFTPTPTWTPRPSGTISAQITPTFTPTPTPTRTPTPNVPTVTPTPTLRLKTALDFNGDGALEFLWWNIMSGDVVVHFLNSANKAVVDQSAQISTLSPFSWNFAGIADFDKAGRLDLMCYNITNGWVYAWNLTGTNSTYLNPINGSRPIIQNLDLQSAPVSFGDVNRDGDSDIIWQNQTTGVVYAWLFSNPSNIVTNSNYPIQSDTLFGTSLINDGWQISGAADFNNNGTLDLIWWNNHLGTIVAWEDCNVNLDNILIDQLDATVWKPVGFGDWGNVRTGTPVPDGKTDVVWYNLQTGEIIVNYYNGTYFSGVPGTRLSLVLSPSTGWRPAGGN